MPYVLAYQKGWTEDYKFEVLQNFQNLRDSVNMKPVASSDNTTPLAPTDAFMWEIFTTKKYYTNNEIKNIGRIYTPWPSWVIAASTHAINQETSGQSHALSGFLKAVQQGIDYFESHQQEAVEWISSNLDYSAKDAEAWLETVKFRKGTRMVDDETVEETVKILKEAKVLGDEADKAVYVVKV